MYTDGPIYVGDAKLAHELDGFLRKITSICWAAFGVCWETSGPRGGSHLAGCMENENSLLWQPLWTPAHFWSQFKVLVLTYKALDDLSPGLLREISPYEPLQFWTFWGRSFPQSCHLHRHSWWRHKTVPLWWLIPRLPRGSQAGPPLVALQPESKDLFFSQTLGNDWLWRKVLHFLPF